MQSTLPVNELTKFQLACPLWDYPTCVLKKELNPSWTLLGGRDT